MSRLSIRIFLVMALFVAFATAGCGGGGGGNSGGGGTTGGGGGGTTPNLATVTGSIISSDDNLPVSGATVTIPGASPVQTGTNGQFTVTNVPLTTTGLTVSLVTTGTGYSSTASYSVPGGAPTNYDLTDTTKPLPLFAPGTATSLSAGHNTPLNPIKIYGSKVPNGNNPPAPPVP